MESFMEKVGANHYAIVYDDIMDALNMLLKYSELKAL